MSMPQAQRLYSMAAGLLFGLLIILSLPNLAQPARAAALCHQIKGHRICITKITRSAKNYWEYRAEVSFDGKKQSPAVYDCRQPTQPQQNTIPSTKAAARELICRYFAK
ncbi:MAG: hypothetical protein AAFV72_10660 [Cyanobacteria bacterium J06635_1]